MIGKVNDDFFQAHVLTKTGVASSHVIIGPSMGVDSAVLKVPDGYMAIAEDPIFPSMSMTADDFAYVTVHIGASDVAVMGIRPQYMTYSLLLPPDTEETYIAELISSISKYASELGIAIVGGHTGYYGSVTVPTIGGITVWGIGDRYLSPKGACEGDNIIITKGTGVEAAALLGFEFKDILKGKIPDTDLQRSLQRMKEVSVVKDATIAAQNAGVHAMHDATEGGVKRGIWEVAQASRKGAYVDKDALLIPPDIASLCDYFKLVPWEVISEGTLVLTCARETTDALMKSFRDNGIEAAVVGTITARDTGCLYREKGKEYKLEPTIRDKFWDVFFDSVNLIAREGMTEEERLCSELKEAMEQFCAMNRYDLLPEIGAGIAYAGPHSRGAGEMAGIPGRIICADKKSVMVAPPKMGGSIHMAECLGCIREHFPEARCCMDLANNKTILAACKKAGMAMVDMPVPKDYWQLGNDFIVDLDKVLSDCKTLPDIVVIPDRINLEKLILVLAPSLEKLLQILAVI